MYESYKLRLVKPTDAKAILKIYSPYVKNTVISFEYTPPDLNEFTQRIEDISSIYPYLVCEDNTGKIVGYCYAGRFRGRKAYDFDVESSIYLSPDSRGKHIGTALYTALFELLAALGYRMAYAGVALPNTASTGLHKAVGFNELSVMKGAGYKHGKWIDVLWLDKQLNPFSENPTEPIKIGQLQDDKIQQILNNAGKMINNID